MTVSSLKLGQHLQSSKTPDLKPEDEDEFMKNIPQRL